MDERFTLVSKVPESALKQIGAGRLKGKSDINPQWKITAITEVYGLCGIGWKYEVTDEKTYTMDNGEIALFMQVKLYVKDKDEWSEPIIGYGGDFIIKKENNNGLRFNDEAYKMCLTDALGNAMKNIGVASDIYRGFWDGSKYTRNEETAIVKPEEPKEYVKIVDGKTMVLGKNGYVALESLPIKALNSLTNNKLFVACHDEARKLMASKTE